MVATDHPIGPLLNLVSTAQGMKVISTTIMTQTLTTEAKDTLHYESL